MGFLASLLTPRALAAILFVVAIAAASTLAYKTGRALVEGEWAKERAAQVARALTDSESNRLRERAAAKEANDVDKRYQAEKKLRAAADGVAADSLQRLKTAVGAARPAASAPATASGTDDDPRLDIITECASALLQVDRAARSLAGQTIALQDYTRAVCVK